jgi:hypothetical protein
LFVPIRIHLVATAVFVAALVVQVFLAGASIAALGGSGSFATHIEFGYTWVGLAALALLITVFVARRPRREVGWVAAIVVLYVIQTLLPGFRSSVAAIAFLHPVNAVLLIGVSAWYLRRLWAVAMAG